MQMTYTSILVLHGICSCIDEIRGSNTLIRHFPVKNRKKLFGGTTQSGRKLSKVKFEARKYKKCHKERKISSAQYSY